MRVTVIGGSGFLGSHVADELTTRGHEVRIYDKVDSPWKHLDQEVLVGDLNDVDRLQEAVSGAEAVYNFAALADLDLAFERPVETVSVNVLGNVRVLEACRLNEVKRFVYASTVYVYSREGGFYRCSKQSSEHYVEEYERAFGLDFTILRYGSLYGPRSDESNGLRRIVRNALETGTVRYEGSPEALRDYIHVADAAAASVDVLDAEFRNQSVLIAGWESVRVLDLLRMIAEILNMADSVEFVEGEHVGHYVRTPYADQQKLARKYVRPAHVDLGQGLLQLIDDVRSNDAGSSKVIT